MGPLQANTETGFDGSATGIAQAPRQFRFARAPQEEESTSRHEPPDLFERIVPQDTYAVWLQRREADRERERERCPQIRWVSRPRGADGRAIVAGRL